MGAKELEQAAASIEKIRLLRVRPPRDMAAAGVVGELRAQLEKEIKESKGMGEAWRTVAPDDLRDQGRVKSFQRGELTVVAANESVGYLIKLWLRDGGELMLAGCAPGTLKKGVVKVGSGAGESER